MSDSIVKQRKKPARLPPVKLARPGQSCGERETPERGEEKDGDKKIIQGEDDFLRYLTHRNRQRENSQLDAGSPRQTKETTDAIEGQ